MKKLIKSKLFLQVIVASMVATLATAGIVAATTIGTNISTGGTLDVTGASTLTGNTAITGTLSVTGVIGFGTASSTAGGASTLKAANINSDTGAISFGNENLTTTGLLDVTNASSTLTSFGGGTTVSGLKHGTCSFSFGDITASSTAVSSCTVSGLTGYKVFVTPYMINPSLVLVSASSTATGIQAALYNTGWADGAGTTTVTVLNQAWSWMAIK